ncbi:hypothetical protein CKAH01_13675 [Colletotrichum kahawae]|uniref:Uncharacterized protein n=1 Tax=Colletotrichum kahawae TaxID=34407 RepID=A0AAD9YPA3_COLKA|nr:hypothetical protein CKAH01_13675 [Colletotrichum kahawae]
MTAHSRSRRIRDSRTMQSTRRDPFLKKSLAENATRPESGWKSDAYWRSPWRHRLSLRLRRRLAGREGTRRRRQRRPRRTSRGGNGGVLNLGSGKRLRMKRSKSRRGSAFCACGGRGRSLEERLPWSLALAGARD